MDDREIFQSAKALIRQHSQDAPLHAAAQIDAMLSKGDLEGRAV
jgi:hypothetical protein